MKPISSGARRKLISLCDSATKAAPQEPASRPRRADSRVLNGLYLELVSAQERLQVHRADRPTPVTTEYRMIENQLKRQIDAARKRVSDREKAETSR